MTLAKVIDDTSGRVGLEVADLLCKVSRTGDEVDVVLQDDIAVEHNSVLVLEEFPGIEQDLNRLRLSEDRQPAHNRAGEKVRKTGLSKLVAVASHVGGLA